MAIGDLGIDDGVLRELAEELPGGHDEIDARGLLVLPGAVDAHVHLNDPGRADWEGIATGSAALAAGGSTTAIDMPLNAHPPTVDAAAFDLQGRAHRSVGARRHRALGRARARATSTSWRSSPSAASSASRRSCARAASTISRPPTTRPCWQGMREAARLGLPVAVHAESGS